MLWHLASANDKATISDGKQDNKCKLLTNAAAVSDRITGFSCADPYNFDNEVSQIDLHKKQELHITHLIKFLHYSKCLARGRPIIEALEASVMTDEQAMVNQRRSNRHET